MKTRLGISVSLLAATVYFLALVGGWIPTMLIAGYILLFETNDFLKFSAIKAMVVSITFALLSVSIDLIPNGITLINNVFAIFDNSFSLTVVSRLVTLIHTILMIVEKVLLLMLGIKALHMGTVSLGVVDNLISRHTIRG